MDRNIQRELGSRLLKAALLPALASASLYGTAALAQPVKKVAAVPASAVARASQSNSSTLTLEGAKSLLDQGNAADLTYRPSLWDWTKPVTAPQVSQIAPSDVPQTTVSAAPAPEDSSDFLDEVSVTATRRPTKGRETPSVIYTVKKDDFRALNAQTVTDALVLIPGFQGAPSYGGVRNAGGVFLRGFDDQRFNVLKDGLPLTRSSNNRSDVSRFQIEDLERVEVVTGGATLRYGSGAVGGVINLITETPSGPPKLTLKYQTGSFGQSRYVAKYGGGDDTFSYNVIYSGTVAFNNYALTANVPRQAEFYGPDDRSTAPSCGNDANGDPIVICPDGTIAGGNSLFGFLKPDAGTPASVSGTADSSFNAQDTYTAKLTFKPDPNNKITVRVTQQNSKNAGNGPGTYYFGACSGGASTSANPTYNFERFLPLDSTGRELGCTNQRYIFNTASSLIAFPYSYNATRDGTITFPTGRSYLGREPLQGTIDFFGVSNQSQTEAAVNWDYNVTPTTTLNSYAYYYKFASTSFTPAAYAIDSNGTNPNTGGPITSFVPNAAAQPYVEGNKAEIQTALNTQISPGQTLSLGLNYVQDRSYQQRSRGRSFFDKSISRSSIFLIDDISFGPELKLSIGGRYTYSTQFGAVGTPGVGIRYTPNTLLSFRSNWNYVFNAPSISDLNVAGGPFVANPGLRPESGVSFDAGVDITPANNLSFRATYYNIYLDGAIGTVVFRNTNPIPGVNDQFVFLQQQRNFQTQYSSGFEFQGNFQATDQLSLTVNWTNSDRRNINATDSVDTVLFTNQIQNGGIPFNNVGARLTYINKGFLAAMIARYQDGYTLDYTTRTPSFFTLDINLEVPVTPFFTLTGNVRNLTDTRFDDPVGIPAPGINFLVGGKLEIGG
ncbi:MAG: TonB-dependent receptor [Anaerolineae bacterium]|nr:TonB-dependent receptor [Gloeobacterales cyanobacterium ES-bin-313]